MTPEDKERIMNNRVQTLVGVALDKLKRNNGRYTSKAYRAYIERVRKLHCLEPLTIVPSATRKEKIQAFGRAFADHIMDMANRPGVLRMVMTPDDPAVVEYRERNAEIERRASAVLATIKPYSRRIYYQNKELA